MPTTSSNAPLILSFVVERYLTGTRIDTYLAKQLRTYTSWRLHRMVRAGQATVNGEPAGPDRRVHTGQEVSIRLVEPPDDLMPADAIPLAVVYEDDSLLVVNKPANLVIHPCGESPRGTLTNAVQWHLDQSKAIKGLCRPGVVHRLDRETSGLVAVAKDHWAHRELSIQFQRGRVAKTYVALVDGVLPQDAGVIDSPLGRVPQCTAALMTTRADSLEPRPSRTAYEVLERFPRHTLVRAKPRTGRLHQIRVHLASIGHPVVGDEYYGPYGEIKPVRPSRDANGQRPAPAMSPWISRHALHAAGLAFTHPVHQTWMEFTTPLPEDMEQAVSAVRGLPNGAVE